MILYQWAAQWGIPMAAIKDLETRFGMHHETPASVPPSAARNEAVVQAEIRLEAAEVEGLRLWRNNVGALKDATGRVVRYGLANDTKALNSVLKSGDLIGCRRVLITPAHVGSYIGQFVSRECKREGWQYTGDEHEQAQLRWIELVNALGGDARFANGRGSL